MAIMKLICMYRVTRGVPQGSVLGPYLWNISYDFILRMDLPENCDIICFADDTLFTIGGKRECEVCHTLSEF